MLSSENEGLIIHFCLANQYVFPIYDVVIIGAGFSGIYLLYNLRKLGYSCRIYESGSDLGGVWHWNRYPGARYPSADEIWAYFAHLDKTLNIKKDVETGDGQVTTCRFLLFGVGFASQRYEPKISGLANFKRGVYHTSFWPKSDVDVRGKKLAVIGTGVSGVRVIQALAKDVDSITTFDVPAEEREPYYEALFERGGFAFILARYPCPSAKSHPLAAKRSSMETDYFEQYNRENVDIVDLRVPGNSIATVTPKGIQLENGTTYEADASILATGFDSHTGSFTHIPNLRNTSGATLAEEWGPETCATSYLGMTHAGYPNINRPSGIEMQGDFIVDAIRRIDEQGLKYVEPTLEAEVAWKAHINAIADMTLFVKANSWYMGANILGKREMLN
ncbi:flavin-containing monooxygenase [Aspergillus undulatus]|uniref:flavin-containing monooxygenase n=1 Tax=Aspergillus undulatus TaxID=1810928 RepID=UPI003CCCA94C